LSITADRRAVDLALVCGLPTEVLVVRQVPEAQPSPVVSFSTVRILTTSAPARRGSELVDVPRQVAFVMRKVFPSTSQVRVDIRVWFAVNAADTSEV
jgi:hypothetical protein